MRDMNEEMEIDLLEIWCAIRKRIVLICLCGILCGAVAYAVTKLFITPVYTAENSMMVLSSDDTLTKLADLQLSTQLTNDYRILITCRPVLAAVIEELELDTDYKALERCIEVRNSSNNRMLTLLVTHENPEMALEIARTLSDISSAYIGEVLEVAPPKVIDGGVLPQKPASPNMLKNVAVAIFIGLLFSGAVVTMRVILDDTVKTEEDVEKYLGLSILSIVPDRKDYISQKKKKRVMGLGGARKLFGKRRG